jgi:hypothetical protein
MRFPPRDDDNSAMAVYYVIIGCRCLATRNPGIAFLLELFMYLPAERSRFLPSINIHPHPPPFPSRFTPSLPWVGKAKVSRGRAVSFVAFIR